MPVLYQTFGTIDEWRKARGSYIGGSDAAAILGLTPYMNNVQLWEIKTGRKSQKDISAEPYVFYGTNAEPMLRELYKLDHPHQRVIYEPNNMWNNTDYPFAHASLDGWIEDNKKGRGILEIKTTTINGAAQRQKWENKIPDNYFVQILHYLLVTGYDFATLKAQIKYERDDEDLFIVTKQYTIDRGDVADDLAFLAEKEAEFYEYIRTDTCPPLILPSI